MRFVGTILFAVLISSNCYCQWVQQVSGTSSHLFGIDMLDVNSGYICGDQVNGILKTTNGGFNWIRYTEPINDQYNSVSFIDVNTGISVGPPGFVLRTSNGGINWSVISQPGGDKGPVHFVSATTAYAAGDDIIKSTDGGLTWVVIRTGNLSQYQGLHFIDENTGTVVGRPGLILTTSNGGGTWMQHTINLPVQFGDSSLFDVKYVNPSFIVACGNNGIFLKSTNAGINWSYFSTGSINALFGLSFIDTNTGYIVGNTGRIIKSTNGGLNWIPQSSPLNYPLEYIDFANANTGWIVGFNGLILKTTNGGVSWINPISTEIPNEFRLYQNFPNPFNPVTNIKFGIPKSTYARLVIYDALGSEITTIVNEQLKPGTYEVKWDGSNYSSGVYYFKLITNDYSNVKKMVLIK